VGEHFEIVRYDAAARTEVFALLRATLVASAGERLIRQWEWKYERNPFNPERRPHILLLKDDRQTIGMLGTLPLRAAIRGVEHSVSHSCDFVLCAKYRNRGIGRPLVEHLRRERPLRFGWHNALSYRSLRRNPGMYARLIPLVRPLDTGRVVAHVTGATLARCGTDLAAAAGRLAWMVWGRTADPRVRIVPLDGFDTRFDDLWRRVRSNYPVILVRDQAYLQWRFGERPDVRYTILGAIKREELVGYSILRNGVVDGEPLGFLVDFLVDRPTTQTLSLLVHAAVEWLRRDGAKAVICRATAAAHRRLLYAHGFVPYFWGPRGYLHAVADASEPAVQSFQDLRQWYVTMGDGDLEMAF